MTTCVAQTIIVAVFLLAGISGSAIDFKSSSSSIKPLVTTNFTLRCALNDTSPSPGSPGAVVGKRGVASLEHVISEHDVMEAHRNKKDSARSVTSTAENMILVTSIIISRDGQDLATMIEHFSAKPVSGTSGFTVTGQLTPGDSVKGFLELVWPHPTPQDAGNFLCDVATLSAGGRSTDFSKTLAVAEEEVTLADLVAQLNAQQGVIDGLKQANDKLTQGNVGMNRTIDYLINNNADMNRTNTALKNDILKLQSESASKPSLLPKVFYTAAYTSGSNPIPSGQVLVYNEVLVNEGGGYSGSTGVFTSPVSGFYRFEMIAVTSGGSDLRLQLHKNGNSVVRAYTHGGSGYDYTPAINSAIVQMSKGDTMKVVVGTDGHLDGVNSTFKLNTFNGQLIAID